MSPKVSIILRTYNQENYITACIKSALNQTFKDFELLILDDCSNDGTTDIIDSFSDSRIKIVKNKRNLGPIANLNIGLSLAKGEFISILDGDDIYHPEKLEKQIDFLTSNPDYGAVFSYIEVIDSKGNIINSDESTAIKDLINNPAGTREEMLKKCFELYNFLAFPTELFRKECAIYFHAHLIACGDGYFHINTLLHTKIKVMEKPLVFYRIIETGANVSTWATGYAAQSEKFFLLDKFLEIKDPSFFKRIFFPENEKLEITAQEIPYQLSLIAQKYLEKKIWANYNFHRFVSQRENYKFLVNNLNLSFPEFLQQKLCVDNNEESTTSSQEELKAIALRLPPFCKLSTEELLNLNVSGGIQRENNGELIIHANSCDPQFNFFPKNLPPLSRIIILLELTCPQKGTAQAFYQTQKHPFFCEENSKRLPINSGHQTLCFLLKNSEIFTNFRLDPGDKEGDYIIHGIEFILYDKKD